MSADLAAVAGLDVASADLASARRNVLAARDRLSGARSARADELAGRLADVLGFAARLRAGC